MQCQFIAYYRVSSHQQGKSGLGLEAQRKAVLDYLNGGGWELAGEFTEVESGKRSDNRPQLAAAMALAKKAKARLFDRQAGPSSTQRPFCLRPDGVGR